MAFVEEKDFPLYQALCKHCYHPFASKLKDAKHCHRCVEMMQLKSENAMQAQRIRHLEESCRIALRSLEAAGASLVAAQEEVARLKKALRTADEAVNIATDRGVY